MLKKVLIGVVGVIVALILIGFALPREAHVERSTTIKASPEQVWTYVSNFENFNKWSPWAARDPKTKYTYSEEQGVVGAKMSWVSDHPNVGSGSQEVLAVDKPNKVELALDFGQEGKAKASYILKKDGDGTKFTWTFDGDMGGGPIGRWFGLMMDGMLGPDYEEGLAKLKKLAEAGPAGGEKADEKPAAMAKEGTATK